MSGLAQFVVNGAVRVGSGPVDHFSNGIPVNAAGRVAVVAAVPANWSNGLPFSGSALCMDALPKDHVSCGIPFAANGEIAASVAPAAGLRWANGLPFDNAGNLIVTLA